MTILYFSACGEDYICQCDCFRTVQRGHGNNFQNLPRGGAGDVDTSGKWTPICLNRWPVGWIGLWKVAAITVFKIIKAFLQYFAFLDSDCWVQHAEDQQRQCDNQALGYWWTTKVDILCLFLCLFVCLFDHCGGEVDTGDKAHFWVSRVCWRWWSRW